MSTKWSHPYTLLNKVLCCLYELNCLHSFSSVQVLSHPSHPKLKVYVWSAAPLQIQYIPSYPQHTEEDFFIYNHIQSHVVIMRVS